MTTTAPATTTDVDRRHDFVLLFDVRDGNPNGDPDAGNLPRVDPETMQGLVTDVAIKRKVRDYVDMAHGDGRFKVYVQHGQFLASRRERIFNERAHGDGTPAPSDAQQWMCEEFFDVRMFGAVMSMKEHNAGQVRGPMQLTFARSLDPIVPLDSSIVGPAQNERDVNREDAEGQATNYGTMGPQVHGALRALPRARLLQPPLRHEDRRGRRRPRALLEGPRDDVGRRPLGVER